MAEKLSPMMVKCLDRVAEATLRGGASMAYPTDSTGKALEKRGLIEFVKLNSGGWRTYRLTEAGRRALENPHG